MKRKTDKYKRDIHKKIIMIIVIQVLAVMILSSCGIVEKQVVAIDENKTKTTTIKFFGDKYEEANVRVIEEIITDFMKENPDIKVTYESIKGTDYFDALLKRMKSGNGDDVFVVDNDSLAVLKMNKQVADLSDMKIVPKYSDGVLRQIRDNQGKIYMLPMRISMFGMYCNMDMLREHNRDVPKNINTWLDTCDYFKRKNITPIVANDDTSLKTMATGIAFYNIYHSGNESKTLEDISNHKEKLSKYMKRGYDQVEKLIERGYVDSVVTLNTKKTDTDLTQFVEGKNPFMLTGAWATNRVIEMKPEFEFEVHPLPVLEDKNISVINLGMCIAVNENCANKKEAFKFVEYITKPENIEKFSNQQCSISPLKNPNRQENSEIQSLLSCYDSGRIVLGSDSRIHMPVWNYGRKISQQLLKGKSVERTMKWLDLQQEKMEKKGGRCDENE